MFEDDPGFMPDYNAPISIGEQFRALQNLGTKAVNFVGGAVRLVPGFLSDVRESFRPENQLPAKPVAADLPRALERAENIASEQVATATEKILGRFGVPESVSTPIAGLTGAVLTPGIGDIKLAAMPLLGAVSVGGSMRLRRTKVGQQFPEVAEAASKYMEEAEAYLKQQGSLTGYPRFTDPTGEKYVVRPRGGGRLAMSPMSVKQAYTKTRKGRDVTSDSFEAFQRKQFNQMVKENRTDLIAQYADIPSYVEHNRRLSSPFWKTKRAKGQKAGDVDNLTQLFDLDFKRFKDNVDKTLDRIPNSPIDAFYDPMVDSIVVENIKTGKQLGYLDPSLDVKAQLNNFIAKLK